eukprot:6103964-Karenia_brevis.AAC.1
MKKPLARNDGRLEADSIAAAYVQTEPGAEQSWLVASLLLFCVVLTWTMRAFFVQQQSVQNVLLVLVLVLMEGSLGQQWLSSHDHQAAWHHRLQSWNAQATVHPQFTVWGQP